MTVKCRLCLLEQTVKILQTNNSEEVKEYKDGGVDKENKSRNIKRNIIIHLKEICR